jgi:hypothetical protein
MGGEEEMKKIKTKINAREDKNDDMKILSSSYIVQTGGIPFLF